MLYTRRRILRDAARVSAVAAASSLPLLAGWDGCQPASPPPPAPPWGTMTGPPFVSGVRVFFIGAWLFFGEQDKSGMLAVTLDMSSERHTFPYGIWKPKVDFNGNPSLCANPAAAGQKRNAYPVSVGGFKPIYSCAQDVFKDADKNCWFNYIKNDKVDLALNPSLSDIRVISLPYPTRIFPVDLIVAAHVTDADGAHPLNRPTNGYGFAAGHVFDYQGASSLSFNNAQVIASPSTGSDADFHFRTVPPKPSSAGHTQRMFRNLLNVVSGLKTSDFSLVMPLNPPQYAGPFVPQSVTMDELAMEGGKSTDHSGAPRWAFIGDTAGCAATGGGVGGH